MTRVATNTVELLTSTLLPWQVLDRSVPVHAGPPFNPWGLFVVYALFFAVALGCVRAQRTYWSTARRSGLLVMCSALFLSYVASHHELELVLTGFYYAGMFNILLIVLLTTMIAALSTAPAAAWAVPAMIAWLLAVQTANFAVLSASWRQHRNYKTLGWLLQAPDCPNFNSDSLEKIRPLAFATYPSEHAPDIPESGRGGFDFMYSMWRNREGAPNLSAPLALRDVWVVQELYFMRGPGRVTNLPARASWQKDGALQWQHVVAVTLALDRLDSAGGDASLPVLALQIAPEPLLQFAEVATGSVYGRLGYPSFSMGDLKRGLTMLRRQNYQLLIVEAAALAEPVAVSPLWAFHHAFRQAWHAGQLRQLGVERIGEARILDRNMTLFALAKP